METDLYYYIHRHYNNRYGQWISRDPLGVFDDNNLYRFVKNNIPYKYDHNGLWSKKTHGEHTKSLSDLSINVNIRRNNKVYNITSVSEVLIRKLVSYNQYTDVVYIFSHEYHFTTPSVSKMDEMRRKYIQTIKDYENGVIAALRKNPPDCKSAVLWLGQLHHMWQDYYGHGRNPHQNKYKLNPGEIVGSPKSPLAEPSTYDFLGFSGNHGSVFRALLSGSWSMEPGERAADFETRELKSKNFTKEQSKYYIEEIIKSCTCIFYKLP